MNNAQYWKLRHLQRMDEYHKDADEVIGKVLEAYQDAIEELNSQMRKILNTYSATSKIAAEEAMQYLTIQESKSFIDNLRKVVDTIQDEDLKAEMLRQINAPAYRARLTRLQALKEQLNIECQKIADIQVREIEKGLINTANSAYYKTIFDIQQQTCIGYSFAQIPTKQIQEILKNNWSGEHFSKRVWSNMEKLSSELQHTLTKGFMTGASIKKMSDEISERLNVGKFAATRLIRTETTYVANASELASYKEAGIEKLQYLATLDTRTSDICRKFDGKIILVRNAVPGKNIPPLHANCRSTTIEVFDDMVIEGLQRRARDPETGKNVLIPGDMKYKDWNKIYVEKTMKRETWDKKHAISGFVSGIIKGEEKSKTIENTTTFEELDILVYDKMGMKIQDDVKALDFELIRNSMVQMEKAFNEFPQLKSFVKDIYTSKAGMMACSFDFQSVLCKISFNPKYYADSNVLTDIYNRDVKSGFHPKGITYGASAAHEFGHAVEAYLIKQQNLGSWIMRGQYWNDCVIAREIVSEALKRVKKTPEGKGQLNSALTANLSGYALKNRSECMAEAFGDYYENGENANILSKKIIEVVKERF